MIAVALLFILQAQLNFSLDNQSRAVYMQGTDSERSVTIQSGEIGQTYSNWATIQAEFHYVYRRSSMVSFPPRTVRLRTETNLQTGHDLPLRITVRAGKGTLNWHVPFESNNKSIAFMERTLCLTEHDNESQEIAVIVSTASRIPVAFRIHLFELSNFTTSLNQPDEVTDVTVATPSFKFVNLQGSRNDSLLQVRVTSTDASCAIVSVQPCDCPVADTEAALEGSYQTMLSVAAFNIERAKYGKGVYIVFVLAEDDALCEAKETREIVLGAGLRSKSFVFEISDQVSRKKIVMEVTITTAILSALCLITITVTCFYSEYADAKDIEKKLKKFQHISEASDTGHGDDVHDGTIELEDVSDAERGKTMIAVQTRTDEEDKAGNKRLPKYVNELATKGLDKEQQQLFKSMFQKSDLYIWLVLMMGTFYGIPAIQLVLTYQDKLLQSGNQDLCYYNFLCSIPVGSVRDFNHIYSNIWYLGFGCFFVFLTWYRKQQYLHFLKVWERETHLEHNEYGLPHHFGIFYAMGFAMIFEGILSACYHVCPTQENYQFDTTFMYVLATLCFIKLYQFRHPDITSNAYKVFFGLGVIMFLEVMGIFYESTLFWTLSLIGYLLVCMMLTSILYHSGLWSLDFLVFIKIYRSLVRLARTRQCSESYSTKRLVLVLILNGLNIMFVIIGAAFQPGISSFLLGIFIGNLLIYAFYYIAMKLYHKERITRTAYAYTGLAAMCWISAIYFFVKADYSTDVSPSQSRNLNNECLLFALFDHHDIWHMLSAAGLFSCFMLVQTLDDGLFYVPRNKIHIF